MHTYVGNFDMTLVPQRAEILATGSPEDTPPLTVRPEFPLDKALNNVKIYEYRLAYLSLYRMHQIAVHGYLRTVYFMWAGRILRYQHLTARPREDFPQAQLVFPKSLHIIYPDLDYCINTHKPVLLM